MGFFHGEACAQEAVALQTLSPAQLQAYSYYIWQKFPVFMARAHHLLQFGMTYTRIHGEKRPLLPPDKVWRCVSPPDLPAVEFPVPRLTDLDKQRLATYSQLFRHKE
jgi:hypothetical protein